MKADKDTIKNSVAHSRGPVVKKVLKNGMTILVRPVHTIPRVSMQIWYNVGSKDEKNGEKGYAHLIEHMMFKGTEKLSETDLNAISHKLSGSMNAFTSWDYTGYMFNLPTQHWQQALPLLADCMKNCAFREAPLNSEMKTVIQELKMYRDDYQQSLLSDMVSAIFIQHPYHYPIVGFKQDLWKVRGDDLRAFYKKHYWPNNATLVVVGDVDPEQVFSAAEREFGALACNPDYKKDVYHITKDISSQAVTLYRDVKQPFVTYSFMLPGITSGDEHIFDAVAWILGRGKGSRLYQKCVNELQLATSIAADCFDLFDHALFFIALEPRDSADIEKIEAIIQAEIHDIITNGLTDNEVMRARKKAQMKLYNTLENIEDQAYEIGKHYLATGNENYAFEYAQMTTEQLKKEVHALVKEYFRPTVMHKGFVLPLTEKEKQKWLELQQKLDAEDTRILAARERKEPLETLSAAYTVTATKPEKYDFPKAKTVQLSNGLKVFYSHTTDAPKVDLILELKAKSYYDPEDKQGLYTFVMQMITEGTKNYTAQQLAQAIEARGISLSAAPGYITMSMLREDVAFGLEILNEVITRALFDAKEIEKVRTQLLADIKSYWDEPSLFTGQLVRENIYGTHPYSKSAMGTTESIHSITRDDLVAFYSHYLSPDGAKLSIVGDLSGVDLKKAVKKELGNWKKTPVKEMVFPKVSPSEKKIDNYPINRDQVVLCYAGLSISRLHPDYDKYLIFDQIFGGGVLHSLNSRLFQLREQSGLFYTINGSLLVNVDREPGMTVVKTIVSLDNLKAAQEAIENVIAQAGDAVTDQEFYQAQYALINSLANNFATNKSIAKVFLYLDKYGFPADYFDTRAAQLEKVSLPEVKKAVKKVQDLDHMITVRVGRVR